MRRTAYRLPAAASALRPKPLATGDRHVVLGVRPSQLVNPGKEPKMNRMLLTALVIGSLGAAGAAQAAGDAAAGKAKATTCAMCHGANGEGTAVGPKTAGLDEARFVQSIQDFKSGKRVNELMKAQAVQLSDADSANLAAYYASLK